VYKKKVVGIVGRKRYKRESTLHLLQPKAELMEGEVSYTRFGKRLE